MPKKTEIKTRTEDKVRDAAKLTLGFDVEEKGVQQGTGQITTFNQLGFKGVSDKPDGWYLPDNFNLPAIILETKAEKADISSCKYVAELTKNCNIVLFKYKEVVGILYNGVGIRVFKNNKEISDVANTLQHKSYYLALFTKNAIDKQRIYNLTKRINDCLHFDFGIKNLYHRMIFTACTLVAKRYNAILVAGMDYSQPLLAINDLHLTVIGIFESDDGTEKIFAVAIKLSSTIIRYCKRKNIIPKRLTLAFSPSVGTLVVRNQEVRLLCLKQIFYGFLARALFLDNLHRNTQ